MDIPTSSRDPDLQEEAGQRRSRTAIPSERSNIGKKVPRSTAGMDSTMKLKKTRNPDGSVCLGCGKSESVKWGGEPDEPKTLCNACSKVKKERRLLEIKDSKSNPLPEIRSPWPLRPNSSNAPRGPQAAAKDDSDIEEYSSSEETPLAVRRIRQRAAGAGGQLLPGSTSIALSRGTARKGTPNNYPLPKPRAARKAAPTPLQLAKCDRTTPSSSDEQDAVTEGSLLHPDLLPGYRRERFSVTDLFDAARSSPRVDKYDQEPNSGSAPTGATKSVVESQTSLSNEPNARSSIERIVPRPLVVKFTRDHTRAAFKSIVDKDLGMRGTKRAGQNRQGEWLSDKRLRKNSSDALQPRREQATAIGTATKSSQPGGSVPWKYLRAYFITFLGYCITFCPILESSNINDQSWRRSPTLQQAVAAVGSQINPPTGEHKKPEEYFQQVKINLSRQGMEVTHVLIAMIMMYWYGQGSPKAMAVDSAWFWTWFAITLAQEHGFHRESLGDQSPTCNDLGLRRKIWWTLVARDAILGLLKGVLCTNDLEMCTIAKPTFADFGSNRSQADLFIAGTRLSEIVNQTNSRLLTMPKGRFPELPLYDLEIWVLSRPEKQRLHISEDSTASTALFDQDVHQLFLPYLAAITMVYSRSINSPNSGVESYIAACCTAMIFQDFLIRGAGYLRSLQSEVAGRYAIVALEPLYHARRVRLLADAAEDHINVLCQVLEAVKEKWDFRQAIIVEGIERMVGDNSLVAAALTGQEKTSTDLQRLKDSSRGHNWQLFPFLGRGCSLVVDRLIDSGQFVLHKGYRDTVEDSAADGA
ncbi:hypothetical protein HDK90DRAFT_513074 [Phyllosticta capitalensis]|uniref:GATA-type domain-containing protein n=1 Tax=Phyllosticta capitalensis TaxID=121624 RepID=A0ABR1YG48_9PEZI